MNIFHSRRSATARLFTTSALLLAAASTGCGVTDDIDYPSPAGPYRGAPGGALLRLPAGLGIDFSGARVSGDPRLAEKTNLHADQAAEVNALLAAMVDPLQSLTIAADVSTKTHSATLTFGEASTRPLPIKIDFADFDLDGDGRREGCSGHTAAAPVCLRVWLDGERFLAGRIDVLPAAGGAGAGHLKLTKASVLPGGEQGTGVAVRYDHTAADRLRTEVHLGIRPNDPTEAVGEFVALGHTVQEQVGAAATAVRTLKMSNQMMTSTSTSSWR